MFAEHKAKLDKSDAKESPPGLAEVRADAADNGDLAMRSGVAPPTPASLAGGLQRPTFHAWAIPPHHDSVFQFPNHMELEEPDISNNFEYLLSVTGHAEGLPGRDSLDFSPFNMGDMEQLPGVDQGIVPSFGARVYDESLILNFSQIDHWTNDQLFGIEPGYMGNIEQLPGGGLYDAQMGEFAQSAWQSPNATGYEGQQEGRY